MSSSSYKAALEAARNELGQLARQREQIEKRMSQLTKIIESLIPLIESEAALQADSKLVIVGEGGAGKTALALRLIDPDAGITQAIKRVFDVFGKGNDGSNVPLTPIDVRGGLNFAGWDLTQHKNPMATIHSVLKRLVEQGWLKPTEKDGKPAHERASGYITSPWWDDLAKATAQAATAIEGWSESIKEQTALPSAQTGKQIEEVIKGIKQQNKAMIDAFSGQGSLPVRSSERPAKKDERKKK